MFNLNQFVFEFFFFFLLLFPSPIDEAWNKFVFIENNSTVGTSALMNGIAMHHSIHSVIVVINEQNSDECSDTDQYDIWQYYLFYQYSMSIFIAQLLMDH